MSTYLQQHAQNPVHWWPWCEDAFAEARRWDVPILRRRAGPNSARRRVRMCPLNGHRHSSELSKQPGSPSEVQCRSMRREQVARLCRVGSCGGAQAFLATMR
jgi:hypothetical protein